MNRILFSIAALMGALAATCPLSEALTFTALGDLPGGRFESIATSISADGSEVIGRSVSQAGVRDFVWKTSTGIATSERSPSQAGDAVSGSPITVIYDSNGITIGNVDTVVDNGDGVMRLTAPTIQVDGGLPRLLPESTSDFAMTGTTDGSTHLARSVSENGAWILTVDEGTTSKGYVWSSSSIRTRRIIDELTSYTDITNDGSVLGVSESIDGSVPAILYASGEHEQIDGFPAGWSNVRPSAISSDASTFVGQATIGAPPEQHAFVWQRSSGYRLIADMVSVHHDWHLMNAVDVSADGKTITGYGRNPSGHAESWVVNLLNTQQNPLVNWLAQNSIGTAGILDDSDGDGNCNLIEFVFETDPLKVDQISAISNLAETIASGGQLSVPIRHGALDFVNLTIEESSDLGEWSSSHARIQASESVVVLVFDQPVTVSQKYIRFSVQLR